MMMMMIVMHSLETPFIFDSKNRLTKFMRLFLNNTRWFKYDGD